MELVSNISVIFDVLVLVCWVGMIESEWCEVIKFDSIDIGWVIMSIGMVIGVGIVFFFVQVGLMGFWVFLFFFIIGYLVMYLF